MKKKRNLNILISLLLFFAGLFLVIKTVYVGAGNSFTAISIGHKTSQLDHFSSGLLLKGNVVSGFFTAKTNNLGGLSFRFDNQNEMSTDAIIFRIKEKNSTAWYYESQHKVDQFQPKELFPFGFPIITNSKNKTYVFEIESIGGTETNAIATSPIRPVFTSKYQFARSDLLKPANAVNYIFLRILNLITDIGYIIALFTYLTPFFIFLAFLFIKNNHFRILPSLFMMIVIILQVIFQTKVGYLVPQVLVFCWIETVFLYKISSYFGAIFVSFFTLLTAIFSSLNQFQLSQNSAGWVFIFLGITIIQGIIELRLKPDKKSEISLGGITLKIH